MNRPAPPTLAKALNSETNTLVDTSKAEAANPFCSQCDNPLNLDANFCGACGSQVNQSRKERE